MKIASIHTLGGGFGALPVAVASCAEVHTLTHRALRVYLVLLARHNAKLDGWSWSMAGLARDTGIHRDHIPAAVRRLEADGLVEVRRGVGLTCTHYRMLVPPSLRREGATVAPTVGATVAPTPPREGANSAPMEGATVAPTVGATAAPTLQRSYTDETEDPPYPHTEGNPPSPPASRGEQAVEPSEEEQEATRGDRIRELARNMGIRPREARRIVERREAIEEDRRPKPAPLLVDMSMLAEMRARGWLSTEQEQAFGVASPQPVPETSSPMAQAVEEPVEERRVFELPPRLAHRARRG